MARGRVLTWMGVVITLGGCLALGIYFAVLGLDAADKLASVIGAFAAIAGVLLTVIGMVTTRRSRSVGGGQAVSATGVSGDVTQVAGVSGGVRIGRTDTPPMSPPVTENLSTAQPAGAPTSDGQAVTGSSVGGSVTQVQGVEGDVDIDQ